MAFETNFKPPKGSAALARRARKAEDARELADAYAVVDGRDQSICWVTGRFLSPGAVRPEDRREHHHLKGRNVRPDWVTKPERIITVSALAHQLLEGGFIDVEGTDARKPMMFHWNASMKGPKPFIIIGKRNWSAA